MIPATRPATIIQNVQNELPPFRRAANGAAASAATSSSTSVSQSDACTANVTAVAPKRIAIVQASAPENPRTPSARLRNAPGMRKTSVAAPSRRPRPKPLAGSSRESASSAGANSQARSFTGAGGARPGRARA